MNILNESILTQINDLIKNPEFKFKNSDYDIIKTNFPDENLTSEQLNNIVYIISKIYNITFKSLVKNRVSKINNNYHNLYADIYTQICNENYNFEKFIKSSVKKYLHVEIPFGIVSQLNSNNKYEWLFNLDTFKSYITSCTLTNDIIKFIFKKIHDDIIITFGSIKFFVLSKFKDDQFHRECINIVSHDSNLKNLNQISYYCSNSEMGLMRFMSKYTISSELVILAKYLDYATETLIDFALQQKINEKIVYLITNRILCTEQKFDILEWSNPINLNLLNIERTIDNIFIEKRGCFSPLLFCFSTTNCGNVFTVNYLNKIRDIRSVMQNLIEIIKSPNANNKVILN